MAIGINVPISRFAMVFNRLIWFNFLNVLECHLPHFTGNTVFNFCFFLFLRNKLFGKESNTVSGVLVLWHSLWFQLIMSVIVLVLLNVFYLKSNIENFIKLLFLNLSLAIQGTVINIYQSPSITTKQDSHKLIYRLRTPK